MKLVSFQNLFSLASISLMTFSNHSVAVESSLALKKFAYDKTLFWETLNDSETSY